MFERLWSAQWWYLLPVSVVLICLSIVVLPILFSVVLALFYLGRAGRWFYRRRHENTSSAGDGHAELRAALARFGPRFIVVAAAVVGVGSAVLNGGATWLPPERVATTSGTHVGWVLDSGDHHLTMLEASTHMPFIIRQDNVVERSFCAVAETEPVYLVGIAVFSTPTIVLLRHGFDDTARQRMPDC